MRSECAYYYKLAFIIPSFLLVKHWGVARPTTHVSQDVEEEHRWWASYAVSTIDCILEKHGRRGMLGGYHAQCHESDQTDCSRISLMGCESFCSEVFHTRDKEIYGIREKGQGGMNGRE